MEKEGGLMFPNGLKGHVVSMKTEGWCDGRPVNSIAVCECGWRNTVAWGEHAAQDGAIHAHWKESLDGCSR